MSLHAGDHAHRRQLVHDLVDGGAGQFQAVDDVLEAQRAFTGGIGAGDGDGSGEDLDRAEGDFFGQFGGLHVGDVGPRVGDLSAEEEDQPREVEPEQEQRQEPQGAVEVSGGDEPADVEGKAAFGDHPEGQGHSGSERTGGDIGPHVGHDAVDGGQHDDTDKRVADPSEHDHDKAQGRHAFEGSGGGVGQEDGGGDGDGGERQRAPVEQQAASDGAGLSGLEDPVQRPFEEEHQRDAGPDQDDRADRTDRAEGEFFLDAFDGVDDPVGGGSLLEDGRLAGGIRLGLGGEGDL